jgi:hypothetical protein
MIKADRPNPMNPNTGPPTGEPSKKLLTPAQRERARIRAFRPLAIELGWIVYEWNRLHEALGELFADLIAEDRTRIGFAVWYATTNERTQRDMLRAAVKAVNAYAENPKPQEHAEILWLLDELNTLAGRRNTAVHSPLVLITSSDLSQVEIMPHYFFGNPRATELRNKSLPEEFKWYRDHLSKLALFAERLHYSLVFPEFQLPERPKLPPRGHYQSRAKQRPKTFR